jgi:hypothetical protein
VFELPRQDARSGADSGRHRRHGRNPASCAAAAELKKRQFSNFGLRAGQIDARRGDANEEQAIEARIAALQSSITDLSVWQFHRPILSRTGQLDSRFSDLIIPQG